jgi:hypothetical protein
VRRFEAAWDAGTGNGQVAGALALSFGKVYANDASERQIEQAVKKENIEYSVSRSEDVPVPSESVDLITAAQALHWFHHDSFYAEVRRVSREGSLIAAWAYGLASVSPDIDLLLRRFNDDVIGPYWPAEREFVESRYETIPFPFERIPAPPFYIEKPRSLDSFLGYVSTWSAVKEYREKRGGEPMKELGRELAPLWRDKEERTVRWPLFLLLGKVDRPAKR